MNTKLGWRHISNTPTCTIYLLVSCVHYAHTTSNDRLYAFLWIAIIPHDVLLLFLYESTLIEFWVSKVWREHCLFHFYNFVNSTFFFLYKFMQLSQLQNLLKILCTSHPAGVHINSHHTVRRVARMFYVLSVFINHISFKNDLIFSGL